MLPSPPPPFCFSLFDIEFLLLKIRGFCVVAIVGSERFLSFEQVLRGDFEGDLHYHEVPQVETVPDPAKVDPIFEGDVPPVEAGVRGSCVANGKVVS